MKDSKENSNKENLLDDFKKNLKDKYAKTKNYLDKFSEHVYRNYKNHTLNTKMYYFTLLNAGIISSISAVYWRNKCFFKFSPVLYQKYCFSYCILISFFFFNSMFLFFTKPDAKEFWKRLKFTWKRLYTREWEYEK